MTMSASATQWKRTAGAQSVHRGDDRLGDPLMPRREMQVEVLHRFAVAAHALPVSGQLLNVDPGLEGPPLPGVDDHAHLRVAVELQPGAGELITHQGVHRVQRLRPVVDQPADRTVTFELQCLVRTESITH